MMKKKINYRLVFTYIAMLLFISIVPQMTTDYMQTVINSALIYFIASLGISVMLGMGGQVSFATSAFMGIGAFLTGILSVRLGVPPLVSAAASTLLTGLISWILGLILFRLKGSYFTFATIALVQIMWSIFLNWKPVTGGPDGIPHIPDLDLGFYHPENVYGHFYIITIVAFICALVVGRMKRTSYGRALASVRDNEIAAQSLGVNVYRTKVHSFVIAGVFAGIAGVLTAHNNNYISASLFTFEQSTIYVIMVMLGGVVSTAGVFFGTFLITMLPEWLRPLQEYIRLIYGISVMLMMVFMPMGLAGMADALWQKIKIIRKQGGKKDGSVA